MALTMVDSPGAVRIRAAALRAASVAPLTAMPQSAWRSAGASLTPSPVMATMWPRCCKLLTISYLSCGKTRPKPSARSTAAATSGDIVSAARSFLEHVARHQQVVAHAQPFGDLIADRDVVARHHLHIEAELLRLRDRRRGIGTRRIVERDETQELPDLAIVGFGDTERPIAVRGEVAHRFLVARERRRIRLGQRAITCGAPLA